MFKKLYVSLFFLFFIPIAFSQNLFQESYNSMNTDEQLEPYSDPLIIRNRQAVMDNNQLLRSVSSDKALVLNLFSDAEFRATIKQSRSTPSAGSFISGSLENGGHITLFISKEGIVRGEVHSPRGVYTIKSSKDSNGNNNIMIRQIDTSKLPLIDHGPMDIRTMDVEGSLEKKNNEVSSGSGLAHSVRGMKVVGAAQFILNNMSEERLQGIQQALTDGGQTEEESPDETVDILMVYTPGAERSEGGKTEIEATIEAEVEKTNQAFENSGLSHRKIKLVAMKKVDYTENSEDIVYDLLILEQKKGGYDDPKGLMDEAHTWRKRYGADMVHLFVKEPTGSCGLATEYYLNEQKNIENSCTSDPDPDACIVRKRKEKWLENSFSVSAIPEGCRIQNVFTHELGHTFGLYHDRYSYSNLSLTAPVEFPLKPYGFGYVNQNFSRSKCSHTIMAYGHQCIDEGYPFVVKELMFSNPDMKLGSDEVGYDPAGVAGEEWTVNLDGPANASRHLDEVWDIVANLYHSSSSCAGQLFSNVPSPVRISASGGTKRYTLSNSGDVDYCPDEDLNLTVESDNSFITASVETKTVTNDNGDESYEYDIAITVRANNSCNSRTGSVSFSGDGISKDVSISQSSSKLCGLISESSSGTTPDDIVSLNFSGENIGHVGGFLFTKLTGLKSLDLSNNNIKILPANAFTKATSLADLDDEALSRQDQIHLISNNQSITGLVNLKTLNLSDNLIYRLSNLTFSNLFNLEELNLSNNRLRTLPADVFSDLVELEELNLSNNQIRGLPAALFESTDSLEVLNVSNNQIRSLPASVFNSLTELEELDLSDNQIANLPTNVFSKNTSLKYLWLHNNSIPRITANAFNTLTNLKGLSLDGNAVRALSANAFSKTTSLEYLWLSADEITSISGNTFSKPTKLKYLKLSINKVTSLPANTFSRLTGLRYLNLSVDKATTLPASVFTRLTNLRYLRLSGESITSLPAQVCTFINNVRYVRVSGFELNDVCPSSSSSSAVSITNFFQRVAGVVSDSIGNNNTSTGVTTSNASAGFQPYNENVITKLYEDNIKPSEISRLTGYDENVISQTIANESLLPDKVKW